jgi:poly(3-hydroxyalkanoate) synthetase
MRSSGPTAEAEANVVGYCIGGTLTASALAYMTATNDTRVASVSAEYYQGSWWTDWTKWVARHGGGRVAARQPGSGELAAIEDVLGSHVKVRDA